MTTMSQGKTKITTRKKLATNNKVLVRTGSSPFFKNYQQPIIKFWWVPAVPVNKTVRKVKQAPCWKCKYLFQSLSVGAACLIDCTTTDCMYARFIALVKIVKSLCRNTIAFFCFTLTERHELLCFWDPPP